MDPPPRRGRPRSRIEQLAKAWTAGASSDYEKVLAIQQHFHSDGFQYSTDVDVADDPDALLTFLTQTKAGFCQQYATAMAVLVRELGLPARVAVGYQAGTLQDDGRYLVQSDDAHAWVEVFFEGYGWLQFEPTPGHGTHPNADPGTYLNPAKGSTNPDGTSTDPGNNVGVGGANGTDCEAAATPRERQLCQIENRPQRGPGDLSHPNGRNHPDRRVGVFGPVPSDPPRAADRARRAAHRRADREVGVATPAPAPLPRAARTRPGGLPGVRRRGRRSGTRPPRRRDARRAPREARRGDRVHGRAPRTASRPRRRARRTRLRHQPPRRPRPRSRTLTGRIQELRKDAGLIRRIVGTYRPGL